MFEKITPEQAGISSANVADFISVLERRGLATHSVLMMKGNSIFAEYYWAPFHRDFCHRMYSETKSYVSIAVGLLEEDGLIDLDKPIVDYFPEKIDGELHRYRTMQTVRDMLKMQTAGDTPFWFTHPDPDRTHLYMNTLGNARRAGTMWEYDSAGSQVLGALVEKIAGKSLFDFLNERVFSKLGTFKTATILKTQNGDSWADSALVCTSRDMASFGRFVLNYGNCAKRPHPSFATARTAGWVLSVTATATRSGTPSRAASPSTAWDTSLPLCIPPPIRCSSSPRITKATFPRGS